MTTLLSDKRIYDNPTDAIGNTPLIKLNSKVNTTGAIVYAKIEGMNPLCSVKDRLALALIDDLEERNLLNADTTIIEPTSGNTGVGLAFICASKGYKLVLTMPETMSLERRKVLKALGAELVLTEGAKGMKGAIEKAQELNSTTPNSVIPQQFENLANFRMHQKTTAEEIWKDTSGNIDYFVAGVGTGGTISGVASVLKERNPSFKAVAVEPSDSPVLSGGKPGPHKIQGIGAGFVPGNYQGDYIDEVIQVSNDDSVKYARQLAMKNGLLVGISSGATCKAALELAARPESEGKTIVFLCASAGERYLSSVLFADIQS